MHRLLGALTVRGRSFVAAGAAAVVCGLLIPEPDLLRIGALLMALPLLSAFGSGRARYRLSCVRQMTPSRLPAGQTTALTIRLINVSRLRTGLLLAEDTVPYALGSRPRFVFEGIGGGGSREFTYQLGADTRGKYTIGPLRVRVADSFGRRSIAASGDDDAAPRAYRTGDSLHRVHWRSTARYGELMVRREEQFWRNTASLFVDTRRLGYSNALFELAVTAAASIGVHLAGEGFDARLVTELGEVTSQGSFRDTLLETLAVVRPSRALGLEAGIRALGNGDGQLIAVLGELTAGQAQELSAARHGNTPALALILSQDQRGAAVSARTLTGAGWRVAVVPDAARLPIAWQELHRGGATRGPGVAAAAGPAGATAASAGAPPAAANGSAGRGAGHE